MKNKNNVLTFLIFLVFLTLFSLLVYIMIETSWSDKPPQIPKECFSNYPFNTTESGQSIYHFFWSNKCCSSALYSEEYNSCWEVSK